MHRLKADCAKQRIELVGLLISISLASGETWNILLKAVTLACWLKEWIVNRHSVAAICNEEGKLSANSVSHHLSRSPSSSNCFFSW